MWCKILPLHLAAFRDLEKDQREVRIGLLKKQPGRSPSPPLIEISVVYLTLTLPCKESTLPLI